MVILIFMTAVTPILHGVPSRDAEVPLMVMCRPTVDQIKNIVVMKKAGLFGNLRFDMVCVYHERELTQYGPSRKYVKNKKIGWISFAELKGRVKTGELFRRNLWTPQFREIFDEADGIIFTGGMDIPPAIYGEKNSLLTEATTPYRTLYESSFLFHLLGGSQNRKFRPFLEDDPGFPVLGICLGAQTMNVAAGGSLIQDIPSEIYGKQTVEDVLKMDREQVHSSRYVKALFPGFRSSISPAFHRIRPAPGSVILKKILGSAKGLPMVLSSHHQSVQQTGEGLFPAAFSMDGKVVEALEHRRYHNVLGVQFHPEFRLLHSGLVFFTFHPDDGGFFSLKNFLKMNPPSVAFHQNLWAWFAAEMKRRRGPV